MIKLRKFNDMFSVHSGFIFLLLTLLIFGLCSCANKRTALPPNLVGEAEIGEMPGVRTWGFEYSPAFQDDLIESLKQEYQYQPRGHDDEAGYFNILALSGGGANGAFGAGILSGWSEAGTRPTFKIVTGISTGALIAPFAFLGPDYDDVLRQVYTSIASKDIFGARSRLIEQGSIDSLTDTTPLVNLIAEYINNDVIAEVAKAFAQGRRLYIGTTNLDAGRLVIWNMGAIAAVNKPAAHELFRSLLLASASIPILFPPVYIAVEAAGKSYDEMHVDGGVTTQVFLYGSILKLDDVAHASGLSSIGRGRIYIVQNMQSVPGYVPVKPQLISIAQKAIRGLLNNHSVGDLYRIYTIAKREGIEFNLVYIPADFTPRQKEIFDPRVMMELFDLGYRMAQSEDFWLKYPPGYQD